MSVMFERKSVEFILQEFEKIKNKIKKLDKIPISDETYLDFISSYKTIEINADLEIFGYEKSINENRYIEKHYKNTAVDLWLIGRTGQGDEWFLQKKDNQVLLYDHNKGEYSEEGFTEMGVNFEELLQMGTLYKQLELHMETLSLNEDQKKEFIKELNSISEQLYDKYPYKYW